jgi:formylglycine-generating enzyme required for sulfatase activity
VHRVYVDGFFMDKNDVTNGDFEKFVKVTGYVTADETLDTGFDSASPVSADYKSPFPFPGTVDKVEIDIAPANLSQADVKKLEVAQVRALLARE